MKVRSDAAAHSLPQRNAVAAAVSTVVASTMAAPIAAQEIEEVIVTATKRDESIQEVPLAITAFSGAFVDRVNLDDVKDLISFTPGITGNSQDSFIDAVAVRGIRTQDFGVGGDPSAAFFKNDLYEGRNGAVVTSLYDLERSEVLRGPQGFLFGRNSIGGAISVHTRKADIGGNVAGYVNVDVAERNHLTVDGAVNVPINDYFATRFAFYSSQEDGFVRNFFDGRDLIEHDKKGIRWSTAFTNDKLSVDTMVEYEDRDQSGSVYRAVTEGDTWDNLADIFGESIVLQGGERDADSDQNLGENDDGNILTLGLHITYDFANLTLVSNTGYKDHEYFYTEDYDGTPVNINNFQLDQEGDYFQQEFRLVSDTSNMLSWYAGVSFYREELESTFVNSGAEDSFCNYYGNYYYPGEGITDCQSYYDYQGYVWEPSSDGNLFEPGTITGKYTGWAAYADLNFQFTDSFDVGVGIRYSDDEKQFTTNVPTPESILGPLFAYGYSTDGDITDTKSWSDTTGRLIARWQPNDNTLLFASWTQGFKAGGFGSFALVDADGERVACCEVDLTQADGFRPRAFEPETVDSYEVGYNGSWFDGRADVRLSGFIYDYKDLQISFFDAGSGANTVENVGQVDGQGIEGTVTAALGEYWEVYAGVSWLDTEATGLQPVCDGETEDSCEGRKLFWSPDWTGAFVVTGIFPLGNGEIRGDVEAFYESERGGGWGNYPETTIPANTIVAARIEYQAPKNWWVGAYVENLTDEFTYDGMNNNGGLVPSHFFGHRRPRTYGVRAGFSWD